jgi:hypothetical protein
VPEVCSINWQDPSEMQSSPKTIRRMVRRAQKYRTRSFNSRVPNGNSPRHAPAGALDCDDAVQVAFENLELKPGEVKALLPSFNTTPP